MKRIQLFEFEDLSWFPNWLRASLTNLIVVMNKLMGVNEVLSLLIGQTLKRIDNNKVVDLGSGSGGAIPAIHKALINDQELSDVQILMTDLYPNKQAIEIFNSANDESLSYYSRPVNATDFAHTPEGLKTMVNCFHHMPPDVARKILNSAQNNRQALLIYEMSDNQLPLFIWWLFLPLSLVIMIVMVLLMTPFVRPLTFRQLFFTYLIPIVPLFYAWDGQASMPRIYSLTDYDELIPEFKSEEYTWEKGFALDAKQKQKGTFLLGIPTSKQK